MNRRGRGARGRSQARMGRASISPVAGKDDPRWDRQRRQSSTDFTLGSGLRVNRSGRDEVAVSDHPDSTLRVTEFGELEVLRERAVPLPGPAELRAGSTDTAVIELQQSVTRLTQLLREQGLVI